MAKREFQPLVLGTAASMQRAGELRLSHGEEGSVTQSEQRYRTLYDQAPLVLFTLDSRGTIRSKERV